MLAEKSIAFNEYMASLIAEADSCFNDIVMPLASSTLLNFNGIKKASTNILFNDFK